MAPDTDADAPADVIDDTELIRFDRLERTLHWSNALFFFVLAATGAIMFFPTLSILVGRRDVVRLAHDIAGFLVVLVPVLILVSPTAEILRADLREIDRLGRDDRRWLRSGWIHDLFGDPRHAPPQAKYNAGQKVNVILTAAATLVLFGTGMIMFFHRSFPQWLKSGAVLVHDLTAAAVVLVVLVHIVLALRDGGALRGIFTGRVRRSWADLHHPRWNRSSQPSEPG